MSDSKKDQLQESELRYRRLFETAQDGILILDFNTGFIMDVNPFLTRLLGYDREELIGKELWEIGPFIDKTAAIEAYAILKEKGYIRYEDLPLQKKNGSITNVEFVSNAYGVNGQRVIQCNIRDISERKILEKQVLEYQHSVSVGMHEMVTALATLIDARDPYTAGHQSRVADLAVAIANEMDFPQHSIEGVEIAAMIHDIGKVSIPAEVLTKPGVLNSFELAMLRSHVQAGFNIVKHIHFPWPIAQIILQHHERLDGSGYPNCLSGDNILEEARIIAVADTVEAMSSNRPYRASLGIDAALQVIEDGSGVLFDEKVVKACLKLFNQNNYKFPEEKK